MWNIAAIVSAILIALKLAGIVAIGWGLALLPLAVAAVVSIGMLAVAGLLLGIASVVSS